MVEVYSLVSSSANHPTSHSKPSQFPGEHTALRKLFKRKKSLLSYQVPTSSWVERVQVWLRALLRGTAPQQIQPSRQLEPATYHLQLATLPRMGYDAWHKLWIYSPLQAQLLIVIVPLLCLSSEATHFPAFKHTQSNSLFLPILVSQVVDKQWIAAKTYISP